jgi:hypothetical protein
VCPKKVSGRWGFRPLWRGGWRDYSFGSSILSGTGCSTALASSRTTHRSKIVMIIPPFQNPNFTPDNEIDFAREDF